MAFTSSALAAPEAFEVGPDRTHELPGGREAEGIVGDFILRNERVLAVISGNLPLRRANMGTFYGPDGVTPGCLYDLTLREVNDDQLTIFAPASQRGPVSWVRVVQDGSEGEAVIETVVSAASNRGIFRRHEYRLRAGWQGVEITTTLRNESQRAQTVATEDRWTAFLRTGEALGITWADAVNPDDKTGYAFGLVGNDASRKAGERVELQPGQTVRFTRFLAVGRSPAEAFGLVADRRGATGRVAGRLVDRRGAPVTTGDVLIRLPGRTNVLCVAHPDSDGHIRFALPPGEYEVEITDLGRAPLTRTVSVRAGETTALDATLAVAAAVEFDIRDEAGRSLPCKAQFRGIGGTPTPWLGPAQRAHGCVDQYHSERGRFRVALPPGQYAVIVTRGIEYSHLSNTVVLRAEETVPIRGVLRRLVDTSGWISADYHNHSTLSGDNICGTDDRVINLAAEHIEFAPTTEHNRLYDWRPHIEKLGLTNHVQTVCGLELTGSGPHLNAFPFRVVPFAQDNGAPVWHPDPRISAITLRDWQGIEPDRWVQINHPDLVHNFIDRDGDGRFDGGFQGLAQLIDGIETQNSDASEILAGRPFRIVRDAQGERVAYIREFIWLQLLNRGHRYAAVAVNDAHYVHGGGVGGWRMYLPSRSDEPAQIDWRENVRHAKAGHIILTTGPFLQVQAGQSALPGDTVRATNGMVSLRVRVQCTDWLDIDRVQILVNGRQPPELNFTRRTHPDWFGNGVVKFDRTIPIRLDQDAHLIVVAIGEHHDLSIGYGTSRQARLRPCAYNNPIFADVDGDGFKPNGDTLGFDLPVKNLSVAEAKRLLGESNAGAEPERGPRRVHRRNSSR